MPVLPPSYRITQLLPHQVFVFGSNTQGRHGKGAALQARSFGAKYGIATGLSGQTYAIVTKDLRKGQQSVPLETIQTQVCEFLEFARLHPQLEFLVTPIGCGLAGYTPSQIAPMFHPHTPNVFLPSEFKAVLAG